VLTRTGLRDDTTLSHPPSQEGLTDGVVDLVRTGVVEIFPLEEDPAADPFTPARRLAHRCWTADDLRQQFVVFRPERLAAAHTIVELGELLQCRHQRLGNIPAPIGTEPSVTNRDGGRNQRHARPPESERHAPDS
jgi:hypothetical protein